MSRIEIDGISVVYNLLTIEGANLKRKFLTGLGRKRINAPSTTLAAIDDLSLTLTPGTRLGVIGVNGAGKSTLLRVMAGALPPTHGRVRLEGKVFSLLGGSGAGLDFGLSGYENVIMTGVLLGETPKAMRARVDEIADFSGLGVRLRNPVATYSSGMRARLRFSILTSLTPQILVMDEGVATADAAFAQRAAARLREFHNNAEIVVMSSHGAGIANTAETVLWLDQGRVRAHGPAKEVVDEYTAWVDGLAGGATAVDPAYIDEVLDE
ncbi:MAG: ATP-binding cassette domain-containing protein [Candidatus Nanopelagicales bacterium]|nr:ATP-binding cassette domain-containing protein [Candidatus Nanopelagicales bacterium]